MKNYVAIFLALFLFGGQTIIAQTGLDAELESYVEENVETNVEANIEASESGAMAEIEEALDNVEGGDIGDISIRFCEPNGVLRKEVTYEVKPLETKDVCIKLFNTSDKDIDASIDFVDGTVTNDESQYKACKLGDEKQNFGQFVDISGTKVRIPSRGAVEKNFSVTYPDGFAGMSYGCVVTKIAGASEGNEESDAMFTIELRKGNFIDIYVDGEIILDLNFGDTATEFPDNRTKKGHNIAIVDNTVDPESRGLMSAVILENNGNVKQNASVSRTMYTRFGKETVDAIGAKQVLPNDTTTLRDPFELKFWEKGFVVMRYDVYHTAMFEYDNESITDEMKETYKISVTTKFFVLPREIIAATSLIILFFVILIDRSRTKKRAAMATATKRTKKTTRKPVAKKSTKTKTTQKTTKKTSTKKATKKKTTTRKKK